MINRLTYCRLFILLTAVLYMPVISTAQITSPLSDTAIATQYTVSPVNDSIYVFHSPGNPAGRGSLLARPLVPGTYTFSWQRYNNVTGSFDPPFYSGTGTQSSVTNLSAGGYRVTYDGVSDIAWVLIDTFNVNVLKNSQGKVLSSRYTCDYITVNGWIDTTRYSYYDPAVNARIQVQTGYTFLWTSDNEDLIIPWPDTSLVSNRSYNPPYRDTWYYLTGRDRLGLVHTDSVLYESIVVKPQFSFEIFDKVEKNDFISPPDPVEGGAPLLVRFKNESFNGVTFEWIFSDPQRSGYFANEITQDSAYSPEYTYNIPGDYYPAIIVTSEAGCIDSFRIPEPINVLESKLEVMNVFSPDGDSFNDYFKVNHESLREFTIRIYNRGGKPVYKADIRDMYSWKGWDGTVLNTGRPATPGAYYYIIEATGWDKKDYHRGRYAGVVYLFRE